MSDQEAYVPTGACSDCPFRVHCHPARKRAVDPSGIGRHTSCSYYQEFDRRAEAAAELVASRGMGSGLLARLLEKLSR